MTAVGRCIRKAVQATFAARANQPPVVWDRDHGRWQRKRNGNYRFVGENSDGVLEDWPLEAIRRVFGPVTTTRPQRTSSHLEKDTP